jgi:hypothetical protein
MLISQLIAPLERLMKHHEAWLLREVECEANETERH